MPFWYFEKDDLRNTPSIRNGMDIETERKLRKEGTRFIMECGTAMILGHHTIATGAVYFHRFYMFHTFQAFPRYVTACCCLYLAGKVEETPKKCRDIITTARSMLSDPEFQAFSDDLRKAKEEVWTLESILLQTIKFDIGVEHPYNFLVSYAKSLKGDKARLQKMVQMAWNFVNDSLSTTVCLQWEPEIIAVALIHLASKLSKFQPTDWIGRQSYHLRWWDMFISGVTMDILEGICHQVLDLYQPNSTQAASIDGGSPPQMMAQLPQTNPNKQQQQQPQQKLNADHSPNAQHRVPQEINDHQTSNTIIENGAGTMNAMPPDTKGNRFAPTNVPATMAAINPPPPYNTAFASNDAAVPKVLNGPPNPPPPGPIVPPIPPPVPRDLSDNFRCDAGVYQRQIQGKNGTFYEHMNVNQAVAPVPINGDNNNMRYPSYTANQPNAIYPANIYPTASNVPYNTMAPQCAQPPPHNIYYNNRISGAYYPGP